MHFDHKAILTQKFSQKFSECPWTARPRSIWFIVHTLLSSESEHFTLADTKWILPTRSYLDNVGLELSQLLLYKVLGESTNPQIKHCIFYLLERV